jgi:hypothetical protein
MGHAQEPNPVIILLGVCVSLPAMQSILAIGFTRRSSIRLNLRK